MTGKEKYPHLFSEMKIRNKIYKNRFIAAPTLFALMGLNPVANQGAMELLANRAKGGFAEVVTGEMMLNNTDGVIPVFKDVPVDFEDYSSPVFALFKSYADTIKAHGAVALLEFCHEGAETETIPPVHPLGPDHYIREDGMEVIAFDETSMQKICDDFAKATKFTMAAGFDGVLVHGGHGFLLQQFISPLTNHRTDEYGGSIENRARFPKRILQAIRDAGGEDMILEVRFSAEEDQEGGMQVADTIGFFKQLEGIVDIIHVSNGFKTRGYSSHTFTSAYDVHGYNVPFAAEIKKNVNIPVAVVGGINDPAHAEEIIAEGKADFVIMGRQCYADYDLPNKTLTGKEHLIRKCLRCYLCYTGAFKEADDEDPNYMMAFDMLSSCSINPKASLLRHESDFPKPVKQKNVLVVGGGVGGLQASITLTERGHKVVLAEKSDTLGGVAKVIAKDTFKHEIGDFVDVLIAEAKELGVDIRLNTEVTTENIKTFGAEEVFICVGGENIVPPMPGIEKAIQTVDLYLDAPCGDKVVLIGGGLSNCEAAIHLAELGKKVTVIARSRLAKEAGGMPRAALNDNLRKRDIEIFTDTKCLGITDDGAEICNSDGKTQVISADTIAYATGIAPRSDLVESLSSAAGIPVHIVGDCQKVGNIRKAVQGAYFEALTV